MYGDPVEELLEKELSGDFQNLMIAVIQAARHEEDAVDVAKAKEDAEAIHAAGQLLMTDDIKIANTLNWNVYHVAQVS